MLIVKGRPSTQPIERPIHRGEPAMSSVEPAEYTSILETIRHWPPDARRGLMNDVLKTLVEETPALSPRGLSAAQVVGLLRTSGPAPTDEECDQILEEERMRKYGQ